MSSAFHAVKNDAEEETLRRYGLSKVALTLPSTKIRAAIHNAQSAALSPENESKLKRLFTWHDQGLVNDALRKNSPPVGFMGEVGHSVKGLGRHVREFGRDMIFGSPVTAMGEINDQVKRHGSTAKGLANYAKNWYWDRPDGLADGIMQTAMLGQDGWDLYQAAATDDANLRRGNLASAAAGIAASPFTGRLGLAGGWLHSQARNAARAAAQTGEGPATPMDFAPTAGGAARFYPSPEPEAPVSPVPNLPISP